MYGARPVKRALQRELQTLLAQALLRGDFKEDDTITVEAAEATTSGGGDGSSDAANGSSANGSSAEGVVGSPVSGLVLRRQAKPLQPPAPKRVPSSRVVKIGGGSSKAGGVVKVISGAAAANGHAGANGAAPPAADHAADVAGDASDATEEITADGA